MAWHAPVTFTSDQLVHAQELNDQLRDNMLILKTAVNDAGKIIAISSTYFGVKSAHEPREMRGESAS